MPKQFFAAAIVLSCAVAAQASTLTLNAKLVSTQDASNPLLFHVAVQVQSLGTTDGSIESPGTADGGLATMQFDVISAGSGGGITSTPFASAPVQQSPSGPSSSKVKTAFTLNVSDFGTLRLPDRVDATPARDPGSHPTLYNSDGDFDALGGEIADTGLNYSNTSVGRNGFQTVATEDWQLASFNTPDHLELVVAGAGYYDFGNSHSNTNFLVGYAVVNTSGANLGMPEPSSFVLISLGLLLSAGTLKRHRSREIQAVRAEKGMHNV
jgi:hypothetical protein